MTLPAAKPLTVEDFVDSLGADHSRVELCDGVIAGRVAGTAAAVRISRNLLAALHPQLRHKPCPGIELAPGTIDEGVDFVGPVAG